MLRRPVESCQYLSIRYTERLAEAGIEPSVGSRGDSYDNAMAESVIGLFKAEVIHRLGPWKGVEDVEFATLDWVAWFNGCRLLEPLGYVPPIEFEETYYRQKGLPPENGFCEAANRVKHRLGVGGWGSLTVGLLSPPDSVSRGDALREVRHPSVRALRGRHSGRRRRVKYSIGGTAPSSHRPPLGHAVYRAHPPVLLNSAA